MSVVGALLVDSISSMRVEAPGTPVAQSSRPLEPRLPELEQVSPELVTKLRKLWICGIKPGDFLRGEEFEADRRSMDGVSPEEPETVALALLRILVEDHQGREQSVTFSHYELDDPRSYPVGAALGELGVPELTPLLMRGLELEDYPFDFHRNLVVALCREGNRDALEPLARLAADRRTNLELRQCILRRIHRIGGAAPVALREVLYEPFRSFDVRAAASLAMAGDPAGAPLLRDELGRIDGRFKLDMIVLEAVKHLTKWSSQAPAIYRSSDPAWVKRKMVVFQATLDSWVAEQDEETSLQREREAYLASKLRVRELAAHSWERLQAAGEDFDFASAALMLGTPGHDQDRILERLARLSILADSRLRNAGDTDNKIRLLGDLLYQPNVVLTATVPKIEYSFLPRVLGEDHGNCLGYTTLYLALADRIGLPLHAVLVPGHVFVRWDDGRVRINVETTAGGAFKSDEEYGAESLRRQAPALLQSGAFLGNLSRRQTLGLVLNNRASALLRRNKLPEAEICLRRGLQLFPEQPSLHVKLAKVILDRSLERDDEILTHARTAYRLAPGLAGLMRDVSEMMLLIGQHEEAAAVADRVCAEDPSPHHWGLAIRTRLRANRLAEADALLEDASLASVDCSEMRLWREYCRDPASVVDVAKRVRDELRGPSGVTLVHFFDFALFRRGASPRDARAAIRFLSPLEPASFASGDSAKSLAVCVVLAEAHRILGNRHEAICFLEDAQAKNFRCRQLLELERALRHH